MQSAKRLVGDDTATSAQFTAVLELLTNVHRDSSVSLALERKVLLIHGVESSYAVSPTVNSNTTHAHTTRQWLNITELCQRVFYYHVSSKTAYQSHPTQTTQPNLDRYPQMKLLFLRESGLGGLRVGESTLDLKESSSAWLT
jgi:hypothetical protein